MTCSASLPDTWPSLKTSSGVRLLPTCRREDFGRRVQRAAASVPPSRAGTLATGPAAGIFSVAFSDDSNGLVVGGDYSKETEAVDNAAVTTDGGRTWTLVKGLSGFRSAVAYVPGSARTLLAVGPSGSDLSTDGGRTWRVLPGPGFHAVSFAPRSPIGWAVGERGAIGRSVH